MNFLEQIENAIRPHATRLGEQLDWRSKAILDELRAIKDELGRPDYAAKWAYLTFNTPTSGIYDFITPIEVPPNEVWLVQSITLLTPATSFNIQTNSGIVKYGSSATGTVIISGSIAFLPREQVQINASGAVTGTVGIIRQLSPQLPRAAHLGPKSEMVSNKNTHPIDRDFDGITPRTGWIAAPAPIVNAEGLDHTRPTSHRVGESLLDPNSV